MRQWWSLAESRAGGENLRRGEDGRGAGKELEGGILDELGFIF